MTTYTPSPNEITLMLGLMGVGFIVVLFLSIFLFYMPVFRILRKMGYSGWWCLLPLVPFGSIIGLWILATATWPIEQRSAIPPPAPPPV